MSLVNFVSPSCLGVSSTNLLLFYNCQKHFNSKTHSHRNCFRLNICSPVHQWQLLVWISINFKWQIEEQISFSDGAHRSQNSQYELISILDSAFVWHGLEIQSWIFKIININFIEKIHQRSLPTEQKPNGLNG